MSTTTRIARRTAAICAMGITLGLGSAPAGADGDGEDAPDAPVTVDRDTIAGLPVGTPVEDVLPVLEQRLGPPDETYDSDAYCFGYGYGLRWNEIGLTVIGQDDDANGDPVQMWSLSTSHPGVAVDPAFSAGMSVDEALQLDPELQDWHGDTTLWRSTHGLSLHDVDHDARVDVISNVPLTC